MGQKIHPTGFRLAVNRNWASRWYANNRNFAAMLNEDIRHPEGTFPPRVVATDKVTGEALTRRADDANAGAIIKRIDTYLETTMPLVEYYQKAGLLAEVDADQSIPEVSQAVKAVIEQS